jgi:twitching motility protein PilT
VFEPHQQHQIRLQLADNIQGIISQRLLPRKDGKGRIPAVEILVSTLRIRDYIRNAEKTTQMLDAIEEGTTQYGMQSFDQHLKKLYIDGLIEIETAVRAATRPADLLLSLKADGYRVDMQSVESALAENEAK